MSLIQLENHHTRPWVLSTAIVLLSLSVHSQQMRDFTYNVRDAIRLDSSRASEIDAVTDYLASRIRHRFAERPLFARESGEQMPEGVVTVFSEYRRSSVLGPPWWERSSYSNTIRASSLTVGILGDVDVSIAPNLNGTYTDPTRVQFAHYRDVAVKAVQKAISDTCQHFQGRLAEKKCRIVAR